MTEKSIQNIYNKLLIWEGKDASSPYPIHKKLDTKRFGYTDIYEWISKTYQFNTDMRVLDAGCGVGYGSLYIAEHHGCQVTGISLSDAEIKKAKAFSKQISIASKIQFKVQSFDTLQPNGYDFIMAIESVKHTLNPEHTIQTLKNALKPKGTLIIIDDFLCKHQHQNLIQNYAKDWQLKLVLTQDHLGSDFILKKDLTPFVLTKSKPTLTISIFLLSLLKPFSRITTIIRGGFYLELLFQRKMMDYYTMEYKRP